MPQRCLEQGFVRAVICSNSAPGQAVAISSIQHLRHGQGVGYLQYHGIVNFLGKQVIYTIVKTIVVYPEIISIFVS